MPAIPTFTELSFDSIISTAYFGLVAPAGTPQAAIAGIVAAFKSSIDTPSIATKVGELGMVKTGVCGSEFASQLKSHRAQYAQVIKDAGIKAD